MADGDRLRSGRRPADGPKGTPDLSPGAAAPRGATLPRAAGVPEYWIVNLARASLEVHRRPVTDEGRYADVTTLERGHRVPFGAFIDLVFDVGEVVGPS